MSKNKQLSIGFTIPITMALHENEAILGDVTQSHAHTPAGATTPYGGESGCGGVSNDP